MKHGAALLQGTITFIAIINGKRGRQERSQPLLHLLFGLFGDSLYGLAKPFVLSSSPFVPLCGMNSNTHTHHHHTTSPCLSEERKERLKAFCGQRCLFSYTSLLSLGFFFSDLQLFFPSYPLFLLNHQYLCQLFTSSDELFHVPLAFLLLLFSNLLRRHH